MSANVTLFDPQLVAELVSKVRGKSSLAALSDAVPVAFTGNKEFVFSMDKDIDIVAENGAKGVGGVTLTAKVMQPIKFEYGARISDEFMTASEEEKINILSTFSDGFAKKLAAGLDKAAFHGINPRTGTASAVVGSNCFDTAVTQTVTYTGADTDLETAISTVEGNDCDVTGIAISPAYRAALAALKSDDGKRIYPDFAFGGQPKNLGAQALEVNKTVSAAVGGSVVDHAIVGDFANMFKWGYGKEITLEVIEYGNPDNDATAGDLKGHNQVYLRCEAYLGWAIFDPDAFTRVKA